MRINKKVWHYFNAPKVRRRFQSETSKWIIMKPTRIRADKEKFWIFLQSIELFQEDMIRTFMSWNRAQPDKKLFDENEWLKEEMLEVIPISILKKWLELNL